MTQSVTAPFACEPLRIDPTNLDSLLEKEWLLSNNRGSFASGTVLGCNTRRYHGILIASLSPPVRRMVMLSTLLETVQRDGQNYELANFEFSDRLHPQGFRHLRRFYQDAGVHFVYELPGDLRVVKSIFLDLDRDVVIVNYRLEGAAAGVRFTVMPLLALRDYHHLQSSSASLTAEPSDHAVTARHLDPHGPALHLCCPQASFRRGPDWWYAVHYRRERQRGMDDYEDVWAPGVFEVELTGPGQIYLVAQATDALQRPDPPEEGPRPIQQRLKTRRQQLLERAEICDHEEQTLVAAADQFIVRRRIGQREDSTSILAGFPWFADWGRDTFISLPGLLLCTGRHDEARQVLGTFAAVLSEGMIPNCFDDYGGEPHYNSIDASLWFILAAYRYLQATGDRQAYHERFYPAIEAIIRAYSEGTRFGIHADADGLITGGSVETQLTWMDARCNGVSFTPRHGKAVEVNALWYNALRIAAETAAETAVAEQKERYERMARQVAEGFDRRFWNERNGCLYDCIYPDGTADAAVRPNQILAVSLPYSPLDRRQQAAVLRVVQEQLLTPYGLRSLSPLDSRYQRQYQGDPFQRDSAYHQGTVWAWLIGPFAEAFLKVNAYSPHARQQVYELLRPLLEHLYRDACLGSVSEIFDGEYPHRPKGCIAQAWSVAELLRIKKLLRQP
ncbi:MAG: glycogen debranching enzyme family protein [Sedimentisphaerales bacterium]|nr:glycogen debranching enzyme family protein [Sedimentisphaerales bacterium]